MKFDDISKTAKMAVNKVKFKGKQYSPEILLATGIVTGVAAVAVAVYQSITKTPDIIEDTKTTIDKIHEVSLKQETYGLSEGEEKYTPEDRKKDLVLVYTKTSLKFAKVYAPAIVLEIVSVTSILASNNIIKSRNAALASAYAAIDRTFKDYRRRVVEELGEDVDNRFRYNIKAKTVDVIETNEDGEAITKRKKVDVAELDENDAYSVWFDEDCYYWDKDPVKALANLKQAEKYLNDLFHAKGYLFYNDIREYLGYPRTQEGQVIGWLDRPEDPDRDCHISFGILDKIHREANTDFINGYEPYCLLSFNCDGPILNHLKEK